MALGRETKEMLAVKLPYLAPIAEQLDIELGKVQSQHQGWARICFDSQGIKSNGKLIIKRIRTIADLLLKEDE